MYFCPYIPIVPGSLVKLRESQITPLSGKRRLADAEQVPLMFDGELMNRCKMYSHFPRTPRHEKPPRKLDHLLGSISTKCFKNFPQIGTSSVSPFAMIHRTLPAPSSHFKGVSCSPSTSLPTIFIHTGSALI